MADSKRLKDKRVDIRVPNEELAWWNDSCRALNVSLSGLIRWCVSNALATRFEPPDPIDLEMRRQGWRKPVTVDLDPPQMESP